MEKYLLLRPNGRVMGISDKEPKDFGNATVQKVKLTSEEEASIRNAKEVCYQDKKLVITNDENQMPAEVVTLLEKAREKEATLDEVQEMLQYLLENK